MKTLTTNASFRSLCDKAERALESLNFNSASLLFRRALAIKRDNRSAMEGLLIADFCLRRAEFAARIAETYAAARAIDPKNAKRLALGLIEAIEAEESKNGAELEQFLTLQNGIDYNEFLTLLDASPSFADLFEKVSRSTNVYISRKKDWYDLLERLIESGYFEIAYRFIESASPLVGIDDRARALLVKLREKESSEKNKAEA
ncbi:MAG: hypothetical protein LBF86_08955 [Helicobacteraceae bacterium]|jgi:hypothetical protein|nr:hypothetical protein [Helicobacteraceae bacterium]